MPRVAVTGGCGGLGQFSVRALMAAGWEVVSLDRGPGSEAGVQYLTVDLTDYGQTVEALSGADGAYGRVDAVVHLAAIPAPGITTSSRTFENNLVATHNVFLACKTLGIRKVVFASSETVLGLPFKSPPEGIPITEQLPTRPESTYAMVKVLEETMASMFCRWEPELQMTALRFSNVIDPAWYAEFPAYDLDPKLRRWNLWSYVDARDAATAAILALGRKTPGFDVFIIAAADTVMTQTNSELVADEFPGMQIAEGTGEHETLLSIHKAREILGYEPMHSWRDHQPAAQARED